MFRKFTVGVLGGSGLLGQTYVHLLSNHPWFELVFVGSTKKATDYRALVEKTWLFDTAPPSLPVVSYDALPEVDLLFSTLPSEAAEQLEPLLAERGHHVISHTSQFRADPLVPVVIPEINPHHLEVLPLQQKEKKWKGWIVSKPNCTLPSFLLPLYPLLQCTPLHSLHITTLQARSGAGLQALQQQIPYENVTPHIEGEERKTKTEPYKLLGSLTPKGIEPLCSFPIHAHCTRVPVPHGHLATVTAHLVEKLSLEEVKALWKNVPTLPLPSAPEPLFYLTDSPEPKTWAPKLGMSVAIGNIREEGNVLQFTGLCNNVHRGASGGGIYIAELLAQGGYLAST